MSARPPTVGAVFYGLRTDGEEAAGEMTIRLKCWPLSWDAIAAGDKTCEIRTTNNRTFSVGDILELVRWDPDTRAETLLADRPMIVAVQVTHIDNYAGSAEILGSTGDQDFVVRLAVLSFRLLGVVRT